MFKKLEKNHDIYSKVELLTIFDDVYHYKTQDNRNLFYWVLNGGLIPLHYDKNLRNDIHYIRLLKQQLFGYLPSNNVSEFYAVK